MSGSAPGDLLRRLVGTAAREDSEAGEEALLVLCEEVVRPLDRLAQGLLARVGVALSFQQVESFRDVSRSCSGLKRAVRGGGELERKGSSSRRRQSSPRRRSR